MSETEIIILKKRGRPQKENPIWKDKDHNSIYFNDYYKTKGCQKITCECGRTYSKHHLARHKQTNFHMKFLYK